MKDIYREGMEKAAVHYIGRFEKEPEQMMSFFCSSYAALEIMNTVYRYMTADGAMKKIEELPHETKQKLWEQAKETCTGGDKEKVVKMCKCIWLVNSILEK